MDEEILSESESELQKYESDENISDHETAQEKKIRLAKNLIESIQKKRDEDLIDKDENAYVVQRLEEDLNSKIGKLKREIATKITNSTIERQLKGHRLSVTCIAVSTDSKYLFSGSKDGSLIKWSLESGMKMNTIKKKLPSHKESSGHSDEILCLALSYDFKFLASGGKDKSIKIWDPETCKQIYSFEGHRDTVSGLAFRLNSHQLHSCSYDRSVKVWNVDQFAYVETLFGHQDKVLGIDSMNKERCLTCGARDRSLRLWKIAEESQLLFTGNHFDSIDCVSLINEEHFFSGSNDSSLAVWIISKKKPIITVKNAHKPNEPDQTGWISAIASYRNSDLLASGSDDGFIRLWVYSESTNSLTEKLKIPVIGFVNDLKFSEDGTYLFAAIGQEHKLGRWTSNKKAKNSIISIKLDIINELKLKK